MDLNNAAEFEKLDPMGVGKALGLFLDQLRESWEQAYATEVGTLAPRSIIISGMGGSSLAGRIAASVFEDNLAIPVFVHNGYDLPSWVDKNTLLIANSYSGNTEETVSSIKTAQNKGIEILGIATGGIMGEMIDQKVIKGVILRPTTNPPKFPKSALGTSIGALLGLMSKAGLVKLTSEEFERSIEEIEKLRISWLPESKIDDNQAKRIAKVLFDKVPILVSGRPLLGATHASRNVLNEIGRTFSGYLDMPEMNHHTVEAIAYPKSASQMLNYVFIKSDLYNERTKLRFDITVDLFDKQKVQNSWIKLQGKDALTQSLELAHLFGWVAYYLSMLNGEDPGPEPYIIELKEALSQPVH